jgi:hypothetical protein
MDYKVLLRVKVETAVVQWSMELQHQIMLMVPTPRPILQTLRDIMAVVEQLSQRLMTRREDMVLLPETS